MNGRQRRYRRGFSIIEVTVAVVTLSVLVSIAAVMFSSLLKSQRQFTLRERQRREFVRLDAMLRSDIHAATSAVIKEPDQCELTTPAGDTWRYEMQDDWLVRVYSRDDKQLQRESFFLRPGSQLTFKLAQAGARQLVEVQIHNEQPAGSMQSHHAGYLGQVLLGGGAVAAKEAQP